MSTMAPIDAATWAASGNGRWYCLFPLTDDMSKLPELGLPGFKDRDFAYDCNFPQAEKKLQENENADAAVPAVVEDVGGDNAVDPLLNSPPSLSDFLPEEFVNPSKWSTFLAQSAAEAELLVHNLRLHEQTNLLEAEAAAATGKRAATGTVTATTAEKVSAVKLPMNKHNLDELEGSILSRGPGGIYLGLPTASGSYPRPKLSDAMKYIKPSEVRE